LRLHGAGDGLPEPLMPFAISEDAASKDVKTTPGASALDRKGVKTPTPRTASPHVNTPSSATAAGVTTHGSEQDLLSLVEPGPASGADETKTGPEDGPSTPTTTKTGRTS
jgi:hypothetical protein